MLWSLLSRPAKLAEGLVEPVSGALARVRKGVGARVRAWVAARDLLWNVPVGLQLSFIYTLLLAATLALLGWALYGQLDSFLVRNTAERLETFTRPILLKSLSPRGEHGPPWKISDLLTGSTYDEQIAAGLVRELRMDRPDVAVAVFDEQGDVLAFSPASVPANAQPTTGSLPDEMPPLPAEWVSAMQAGSMSVPERTVISRPGSPRQLVVLTPVVVRLPDGVPAMRMFLQQVVSLEAADAVLSELRLYILLGIIVGTAIGITAGLAVTRVVLRPLDRMARTAEAIAGGDLQRRLQLPDGTNEVARLGSAFDHMVDRLASTLEVQKRFVADASHELRTPLTSMQGLSEMLLMGADRGDPGVMLRTLRSMHTELGRMSRLVSDLLVLSRLDSNAPVRMVPVNVSQIVADAAEQMRPLAEAKRLSMQVHTDGPATVRGEPDKLKQVVLNLLDNAIRYTPEGGEVALSVRAQSTAHEVCIEVRDTGPGIASQDLPHIFDRFYRGDASRTRATGNTGLGLAIVRAIVEAHGGEIGVSSVPGEGSVFRVVLKQEREHRDRGGAPYLTASAGLPPDHRIPERPTRP
jgi:two-component system OmpR family sensor kinase